jgi:Do/DeqQ family serine protease
LPGLLLMLVILAIAFAAPSIAGRIQYSITRAQLRARYEAASDELTKLEKNAELVKLADTAKAFRLVAERIAPSVVHIDTEQISRQRNADSVFDEFFGNHGGGSGTYRAIGQGSGVIVNDDGHILTNYHVIQGASRIEVRLSDGRVIDQVKPIGFDVLTDLAVLKIDAPGLIAAKLGDSSQLEVGDWVLAVGNPYGLDRTVTCGIVSAKQRRAFAENSAYQNFLQTDAAVNPGNSGGPLVDIQGNVVGITTAIVGKAYQGISFAIPSDIITNVYDQLIKQGSVERGYLGVGLQELTPELAQRLKLGDATGVIITGVQPNSPAAKAGLQPADVVVAFDGQEVHEPSELRLLVAGAKIGSKVTLKIIRDGKAQTVDVVVAARKDGK